MYRTFSLIFPWRPRLESLIRQRVLDWKRNVERWALSDQANDRELWKCRSRCLSVSWPSLEASKFLQQRDGRHMNSSSRMPCSEFLWPSWACCRSPDYEVLQGRTNLRSAQLRRRPLVFWSDWILSETSRVKGKRSEAYFAGCHKLEWLSLN